VRTEVKPVAENEVMLEIEVPEDEVQRRYDQTLTRLAREASVPGFRKGKVPRQIVLGRLGDDYVRNETLQEFLPDWYDSALRECDVDAVSLPELDLSEFQLGQPFTFTAKVQVRPVPTLGSYTGLEVPKRAVDVTDAHIDEQLAMLQERFASLKPVEDRGVQPGDFVVVDLQGSADGEPIEGAGATNYMVQVGAGQLMPGFEDNLVGLAPGEHKEFDVTFPDDYSEEALRGRPATFAVDVKEIKEKVVPELGDGFAQEVSEFDTLEQLKGDIRDRLSRAQEAAAEREFRSRVVDAAVATATLEVPPAMVEREAHNLVHDLESSIGEQGLTMDVYLKVLGKTAEEVEEELKPRAEANVRRRLVLDAIRAAEDIQVSDDDVRERIKADAELIGRDGDQLVLDVYASGRQGIIRDELLMARTVDFLVEHAVATAMPADAGSETVAAPADDADEA
jgi:trigger factor